ncbi:hypothetical protein GCM10011338_27680 [Alteromonas lipolytica]|nr:hypothetical protein GCM10011338_27680 [Alteromonas lipolytica]
MVGLLTNHLNAGLTACIGALLGLYSPSFTPGYRASTLVKMIVPFGASFTLGLLTQSFLPASALSLSLVSFIAVYLALYKQMRPPAAFFFIMVCCLSKTHHVESSEIPFMAGAFFAGSLFATSMVLLHDLLLIRPKPPRPETPDTPLWQPALFTKALVVGITVGGSYYLAGMAGIDNPYWVPITVAAVLQGQRMTDFWQRSLHRSIGTGLGMLLATGIFSLSPSPVILVALLFVLAFTIEMLIAKNYALACVFITPLTVILAHTAPIGYSAETLIIARMTDVLIGATFALMAGLVLKILPYSKSHRVR